MDPRPPCGFSGAAFPGWAVTVFRHLPSFGPSLHSLQPPPEPLGRSQRPAQKAASVGGLCHCPSSFRAQARWVVGTARSLMVTSVKTHRSLQGP